MKIGDISNQTGLSVHTLRYYERIGLIPMADRDASGQRIYDKSIFPWVEFLGRLKATGMSIQGMLRYATLRAAGSITEPERCSLLIDHRNKVHEQITELQAYLLVLDAKIAGYSNAQREHENARRSQSARNKAGSR